MTSAVYRRATAAPSANLLRCVYLGELLLVALAGGFTGPLAFVMVPAGFGFFAAIVSPRELARSRWARIYLHGCAAVASMVLLLLVIGLVWRP